MNQDHVFIELVLSDPSPNQGVILGLAAVRTDKKGKVLAAFSERVKATGKGGVIDAEMDEESEWKYDHAFKDVWKGLTRCILDDGFDSSFIVVARYADLYRRFLREALDNKEPFPKKAWLDIIQLSWPLAYNDMVSDRSFDTLCKHLDVENLAPDTATGNSTALVAAYWKLMSRYKLALLGEETVRGIGGEPLAKLRNWIGI